MAGHKVLLLKPTTFMNLSGQSVGEAVRFHKVALDQVTVFTTNWISPLGNCGSNRAAVMRGTMGCAPSTLIWGQTTAACGSGLAIRAIRMP